MKRLRTIIYLALPLIFALGSCQKKLDEQPRAILTPDFLSTAQGLQLAMDAAYGSTRTLWGTQDLFTMTVIGTDEFITGIDGNNDINKYNSNYTPSTGVVGNVWKACYTFINTCNGIVDYAPAVTGMDTAVKNRMVAEAKFLRANVYFALVQFWGDVTLNEHFQNSIITSATRAPMKDVYDFIVQDLKDAIAGLPAGPFSTGMLPGKANKAAAMHVLSKVYLTRAGSSAKQADDYRNAYTVAMDLINNVAPAAGLSLQPDFADVYREGNENNSEVLWTVQHTSNLAYNGPNNSGGTDNVLNHMWVPRYEEQSGMQRSTLYGRPYIRCIPTRWLLDTVFAERVNDSRYQKTFQVAWLANNPGNIPSWPSPLPPGAPAGAVAGQPKFKMGDTAIFMPGHDVTDAEIAAAPYKLMPPRTYTTSLSPAMFKYFDTKRADMNYPSIRPVIVYRLADTYLIAAEALFMDGRAGDALRYINAIRERAAYPTGNPQQMDVQVGDLSQDFILDERSRELCGELVRWWDLVRTGKLLQRIRLHNTDGTNNIQAKHVLRPIPQTQLDAVTTGEAYPQNEGWN
ncbi:RagB/SusD family nutrient uptake outer membrane protein [Chitinophaga agrisoli]|uniref:RagB/SusD family nutrient uptake outer membrane protein n=1 Tax=Chitinophaga agrisoli TaxID=2607653 RepID=A0A5B2W408_9BACT|nr:RagB/SusD family nutrient uptake outer membrane protein [Chitinophaga agrisoli]KAA2245422.1 RagB/SusD family nutrient uptake outer membrane protein [Chitinophaga agrisoli]